MGDIPAYNRTAVKVREGMRCLRCGGAGTDWHHRRTRSVKDEHQHCQCNGILLCRTCHSWVHGHPFQARRFGWIVSRHTERPAETPILLRSGDWVTLSCTSLDYTAATDPEEDDDQLGPSTIPIRG